MIAGAVEENLRLVFEPAKGARVDDPRAVAMKFGSIIVAFLRIFPPSGFAGFLRERRKRRALGLFHLLARSPAVLHLFDVDLVSSHFNLSRSSRSVRRACNRTMSRSKSARSSAVKVSQMQTIQKKRTRHGCSCGFKAGCKKVNPEISSNSAIASRTSIAFRRVC